MELITTSVRIPAPHDKVLRAITTSEGHGGWWVTDCDVGRAAGEDAVYRFDGVPVVFRIDRVDGRGLEMTCTRCPIFADWIGTHITIRAIEDGSGTYVDILHDGYPERNGVYERCASQWGGYAESLRSYCVNGRGQPYGGKGSRHATPL
jgi:uncharacterized protein YndB with AHSA1/START domain